MSSDTEECYRKLLSQPGVIGLIVLNLNGIPIKSTLDQTLTVETLKYVALIAPLVEKTRNMIRELVVNDEENNHDDLCFLRLKARDGKQILISPESNYIMIVIQTSSHHTTSKYKSFHSQNFSVEHLEEKDYDSIRKFESGNSKNT